MNLKKTILSLAIAGATAAPMIASAANGSVYGNIRYGFSSADAGGVSETVNSLHNFGSRWGMKGETDLGNGMTAYGHYEANMFTPAGPREAKIGVKGDFGDIYMGDGINHTWDSMMTTDNTWWYGGTQHITEGAQSNAITYMGGSGPVSFGITAEMAAQAVNADEEAMDRMEVVVGYDAGVAQVAIGMSDQSTKLAANDPEAVMGLLVKSSVAGVGVAFDYQAQDGITAADADLTSIQLELSANGFIFQYGQQEASTGAVSVTPTALVLGYTQSLGPDTLIYYEYLSSDSDVVGVDTATTLAAVLKYNIM
jgi:predicted porin